MRRVRRPDERRRLYITDPRDELSIEVIERAESMGFKCDTPGLKEFVRSYVDERTG